MRNILIIPVKKHHFCEGGNPAQQIARQRTLRIQYNKPWCSRTKIISCVCLAFALITTGCGYRLSGYTEDRGRLLSPVLKRVSVEGLGRYESLRKTLVATLRGYGVRIVVPGQASARLVFDDRRERQRRSAVGDDVKASEYLLTVEASFRVIAGSEKPGTLLEKQTVRAEAAYLSSPDRPLLTESEKRAILEDVEAELCRKIVLRLATI